MSGEAKIEVFLSDGRTLVKKRIQAKGGPEFPLELEEFHQLYKKYTRIVLSNEDIEQTWEILVDLENIEDPNTLLELLYK